MSQKGVTYRENYLQDICIISDVLKRGFQNAVFRRKCESSGYRDEAAARTPPQCQVDNSFASHLQNNKFFSGGF